MSPLPLLCAAVLALAPRSWSATILTRSDGQVTFTTRDTNGAATQLWRVQTTAGAVPERINARLDALASLHEGVTPRTVGADKGYHRKEFVSGCRDRRMAITLLDRSSRTEEAPPQPGSIPSITLLPSAL